MKHKDDERTFKDPVCGMEVSWNSGRSLSR
jgi:YHS domain-containing protein